MRNRTPETLRGHRRPQALFQSPLFTGNTSDGGKSRPDNGTIERLLRLPPRRIRSAELDGHFRKRGPPERGKTVQRLPEIGNVGRQRQNPVVENTGDQPLAKQQKNSSVTSF